MDIFFKHFVGIAFIFLVTICICTASYQSVTAMYTEGKKMSTSYTTLLNFSKIQCVDRCIKDKLTGGCTLAGYNTTTMTCYLSIDDPQDVLDADDTYGVFFYEPVPSGIFYFKF